jgi:molybdenum cofactor cytidylyltransferase
MRFFNLPPAEAEGCILVHSLRAGGRLLKKGRVLGKGDVQQLLDAGISSIAVARLEAGDVPEDAAAARIASALAGGGARVGAAFTGRSNLYAANSGIVVFDPETIDAINGIDESITVATLPPFASVNPGEMIATVKIIPYAAPSAAVESASRTALGAIRVAAFSPMRVALISTFLEGQKPALLDKNRGALDARLAPLGGQIIFERRVAHRTEPLSHALLDAAAQHPDIYFVFGASAIADRRDIIPSAIVSAGGEIQHFGMPVDPGNLLLLARLNGVPAIGLPSCARSPKTNGFDFVLQRIFAGLPVSGREIMLMGVGGLLQEIPSRPQPRDAVHSTLRAPRIGAIVLAAGLSSRMGANKLLQEWRGKPLLRWTVEAALASEARPVIVVTGYEASNTEAALRGLDVVFVRNPGYRDGLSGSLKAGLSALPDSADGALIMLGDMPEVGPALLNRLIAAFSPPDGRSICVAAHDGKRGNPVLWSHAYFGEIATISGDTGAKQLLAEHEEQLCEIEADGGVLRDIDTPDALAQLRAASPA